MNKNLLNVDQVVEKTNLSKWTLYRYACERKIPHIKIGKRVLFDPEDLQQWIDQQKEEATNG